MDSDNTAPNDDANKLFDEAPAAEMSDNAPEATEAPVEGEAPIETEAAAPIEGEAPIENNEIPAEEAPVEAPVEGGEGAEAPAEAAGEAMNSTGEPSAPATETQPIVAAEEKKKGKGKAVLGGVLVVLLFAAAIFGAWYWNNNKKPQSNDTTEGGEATTIDSYRMSGNGLSEFDLSLLKLDEKHENLIYSPLSIKYALNMIADGSDGEAKEEITNILGDYKAKKYLNSTNRTLANAFFVRNSMKDAIVPSYIDGLQSNYGADVVFDDFANADNINNWVSNQTLGIIDGIVEDYQMSDLNYLLINALAIDMNWEHALQCAPGSVAPSINYSAKYDHEDYKHSVDCVTVNMSGEPQFEEMEFNGTEGVKGAEIGATINNYDIVKTLGEDAIRAKLKEEYKKWYADESSYKPEGDATPAEIPDAVLDTFVKELDENYKKVDVSTDFYWNEDDSVKVFAKDLKEYDGATLQYIGIMPKETELSEYLASASAESISELADSVKEIKAENFEDGSVIKLTGSIPFFKYNKDYDLKKELKKVGIEKIFDSEQADLSKMLSVENQAIDLMGHKADIEFSNDGIKAAAVTYGGGMGDAAGGFDYRFEVPVTEIDINFDKPFFYIIRDKATGEVWFAGATYELEAE